jgi:hypothetical protein
MTTGLLLVLLGGRHMLHPVLDDLLLVLSLHHPLRLGHLRLDIGELSVEIGNSFRILTSSAPHGCSGVRCRLVEETLGEVIRVELHGQQDTLGRVNLMHIHVSLVLDAEPSAELALLLGVETILLCSSEEIKIRIRSLGVDSLSGGVVENLVGVVGIRLLPCRHGVLLSSLIGALRGLRRHYFKTRAQVAVLVVRQGLCAVVGVTGVYLRVLKTLSPLSESVGSLIENLDFLGVGVRIGSDVLSSIRSIVHISIDRKRLELIVAHAVLGVLLLLSELGLGGELVLLLLSHLSSIRNHHLSRTLMKMLQIFLGRGLLAQQGAGGTHTSVTGLKLGVAVLIDDGVEQGRVHGINFSGVVFTVLGVRIQGHGVSEGLAVLVHGVQILHKLQS